MPEVPIVGQPCTVLAVTPLILLQCHCRTAQGSSTLLQIFGLKNVVVCPNCEKGYVVNSVNPLDVAVLLPQKPGLVS